MSIRSANYEKGKSGFLINFDGDAEFSTGVFRGKLDAATGTFKGFGLYPIRFTPLSEFI